MITDSLIGAFVGVLHVVLDIIPDTASWDTSQFASAMSSIGSRGGWVSQILPLHLAVLGFQFLTGVWAATIIYRLVLRALQLTHILGGSS